MRAISRALAAPATVGMFLVLVMGATVTNTGSAEGCGRSWPLCNGQFVPELAAASLIEYSHRAVTGLEGILVAVLALAAWMSRRDRTLRVLIAVMLGTLLLQAGMGAWAVLAPQTPLVLATHFGISLVCLAATFVLATVLRFRAAPRTTPLQPAPVGYVRAAWALALFSLLVVYLGAYVRHANLALACAGWPLCTGQIVPPLNGAAGVVFAHRLAALLLIVGLAWIHLRSGRLRASRPDLSRATRWALQLVLLQTLSGAFIAFAGLTLLSTLLHAALMSLLFAALSYLCFRTLSISEPLAPPAPIQQSRGSPIPASPGA